MSDESNLVEIINLCWDSVNKSKVGPTIQMTDGIPQINNIAVQTFYMTLSNIIPKNLQSQHIEPKEPWQ